MTQEDSSQSIDALDAAMAHVARERFRELMLSNRPRIVAQKTLDAFVQLKRLSGTTAPLIDEYFALFYMLWYQPQNMRIALLSMLDVPAEINPLSKGGGSIYVYDFACGTLATLFGTLLAASSQPAASRNNTALSVYSKDANDCMELIGWRLFYAFCAEIEDTRKYPQLSALRMVCESVQFDLLVPQGATILLTAHHAAYADQAVDIGIQLDALIQSIKPNGIIVSAREYKAASMFKPQNSEPYSEGTPLDLQPRQQGTFPLVKRFRGEVATFVRRHAKDLLRHPDYEFVPNWLETDVLWSGRQTREESKPVALCYVRNEQVMEDGLPF